MIRGRSSLQR